MSEAKVTLLPGVRVSPDMLITELFDRREDVESISVVVRITGEGLRTLHSGMNPSEKAIGAACLMAEAVEDAKAP